MKFMYRPDVSILEIMHLARQKLKEGKPPDEVVKILVNNFRMNRPLAKGIVDKARMQEGKVKKVTVNTLLNEWGINEKIDIPDKKVEDEIEWEVDLLDKMIASGDMDEYDIYGGRHRGKANIPTTMEIIMKNLGVKYAPNSPDYMELKDRLKKVMVKHGYRWR